MYVSITKENTDLNFIKFRIMSYKAIPSYKILGKKLLLLSYSLRLVYISDAVFEAWTFF